MSDSANPAPRAGAKWTEEERERLRHLRRAGLSIKAAASALGRSERSVVTESAKLGETFKRIARKPPSAPDAKFLTPQDEVAEIDLQREIEAAKSEVSFAPPYKPKDLKW